MATQEETTEMKNQIKVQTHQIYQFKQDINSKESSLLKVGLNFVLSLPTNL